jgi:polyadenylate-binding protein
VAEAMQVLQEVGASSVGDQLGSLALNDWSVPYFCG